MEYPGISLWFFFLIAPLGSAFILVWVGDKAGWSPRAIIHAGIAAVGVWCSVGIAVLSGTGVAGFVVIGVIVGVPLAAFDLLVVAGLKEPVRALGEWLERRRAARKGHDRGQRRFSRE